MSDLILCIICTGGIFLVFRYFKSFGVNTPMAIVINYAVAAGFGWTLAGGSSAMVDATKEPWFLVTTIMGAGFLFLFNLIAKCTKEFGVAVASLSAKLSLIIPATIFLVKSDPEKLSELKMLAFVLAICAIVLSSVGKKGAESVSRSGKLMLIVPAIIFLGSGGIDTVFGIYSENTMPYAFTSIPFTVAFTLGIALRMFPKYRYKVTRKEVVGGLVLGLINFGSLYYLLGAFANSGMDKWIVIPQLNLSVVIFSTVAAGILFKEKPSAKTTLGLTLGLISIGIFLFAAV